jgi:hypothetical protein
MRERVTHSPEGRCLRAEHLAAPLDDHQQLGETVLLLDEGSAAINEQRGGVTVAPEHRAGRNHCLMTQTHEPTAPSKKTCKRRPFRKRLKGFEPSTFCMASRSWDWVHTLNVPAKGLLLPREAGAADASDFTRNHGSLRTETGLTLIRRAARLTRFGR